VRVWFAGYCWRNTKLCADRALKGHGFRRANQNNDKNEDPARGKVKPSL
jgi:hypothetical protein